MHSRLCRVLDFDVHDEQGTQQPLDGSDLKARPLFLTGDRPAVWHDLCCPYCCIPLPCCIRLPCPYLGWGPGPGVGPAPCPVPCAAHIVAFLCRAASVCRLHPFAVPRADLVLQLAQKGSETCGFGISRCFENRTGVIHPVDGKVSKGKCRRVSDVGPVTSWSINFASQSPEVRSARRRTANAAGACSSASDISRTAVCLGSCECCTTSAHYDFRKATLCGHGASASKCSQLC